MKRLIFGLAALSLLAMVSPAGAQQNDQNGSKQGSNQGRAGTGGESKPGVAGQPGSKAGPTVTPSGQVPDDSAQQQAQKRLQDETGVQSKGDTEAGPASKGDSDEQH